MRVSHRRSGQNAARPFLLVVVLTKLLGSSGVQHHADTDICTHHRSARYRNYDIDILIYHLDSVGANETSAQIKGSEILHSGPVRGLMVAEHGQVGSSQNKEHQLIQTIATSENRKLLVALYGNLKDAVTLTLLLGKVIESMSASPHAHEVAILIWVTGIFASKSAALASTRALVERVGKLVTPANAVYICADRYHGNSTQQISLLTQEAYTLRDKLITREVPLKWTQAIDIFPSHFVRRRLDFAGATVIGVGVEDDGGFRVDSDEFDSGFSVDVYRYMRDLLHFTEKSMKGSGYISPGPNHTLTGFATQINADAGDIGVGTTELMEYRLRGPDSIWILIPVYDTLLRAFFRQPPGSVFRNIFMAPFTSSAWVAYLGIWGAVLLTMCLISRTNCNTDTHSENVQHFRCGDAILLISGAISQRGWRIPSFLISSISSRIVLLASVLTGLVAFIAYSAALVSILSISDNPVQSFSDLTRYEYDIQSNMYIPTATAMIAAMEQNHELPTVKYERGVHVDHRVDSLFTSRLAILTPNIHPYVAKKYSTLFICDNLHSVPAAQFSIKMGPFVKRGSPLRLYLNYAIVQMKERGILTRLKGIYVGEDVIRCLEKGSAAQHRDLGFQDVFTAFVAVVAGAGIAAVMAACEIVYFRMKMRRG